MKKSAKQKDEPGAASSAQKNTQHFTTKKRGYKEEVYHGEAQSSYEKSDMAKENKKNTAGPAS